MTLTAAKFTEMIRADFLAHWEPTSPPPSGPDAPLTWDGLLFDIDSDDAKTYGFARLAVRHFDGNIAALGTRLFRRTGQIYVQVFEPADKGTEITAALAEYAVEFLEKGVDYARITTPGILDIGPDGLGWYQRQANASFSYDRWT